MHRTAQVTSSSSAVHQYQNVTCSACPQSKRPPFGNFLFLCARHLSNRGPCPQTPPRGCMNNPYLDPVILTRRDPLETLDSSANFSQALQAHVLAPFLLPANASGSLAPRHTSTSPSTVAIDIHYPSSSQPTAEWRRWPACKILAGRPPTECRYRTALATQTADIIQSIAPNCSLIWYLARNIGNLAVRTI